MDSSTNIAQPLKRHHDPLKNIHRGAFEQSLFYFFEFLLSFSLYYFLAIGIRALNYLTIYSLNPQILLQFHILFWISLCILWILAKIFNRYAVFFAGIAGEFFLEWTHSTNIQWVLIVYVGWSILAESFRPYRGGEYYQGKHVFKQIGFSLAQLLLFLPILFFGFIFNTTFTAELTLNTARWLLLANFFVNNLLIIIPSWLGLWILDRLLSPYFPLSKEEEAILVAQEENEDDEQLKSYFPQPGECYVQSLTHHSFFEDDHTIVIQLGKVRVYLCTRCTAMILGAAVTFFIISLITYSLEIQISGVWAFWFAALLPLLPLTDWGLQALLIRKATTSSRLFTGFIIGVAMNMITLADSHQTTLIIIILGYFLIFGVLSIFRKKFREKRDIEQELLSKSANI
ncbi:DUF2085 domain-containing protein [Candidatus Lokiarchaeum ossiferum]|uniref:DUF2085 domain-containing protein n=1 Tax=Candidatus Lokiarchaeum ossiferum TaxID=2951803 RepID=UPI00352D7E5F